MRDANGGLNEDPSGVFGQDTVWPMKGFVLHNNYGFTVIALST